MSLDWDVRGFSYCEGLPLTGNRRIATNALRHSLVKKVTFRTPRLNKPPNAGVGQVGAGT